MAEYQGEAYVLKTGINDAGRTEVMLKNPIASANLFERTYVAPDAAGKQYLAIALSAIATNKRVYCRLVDYNTEGTDIGYFGIVSS